MKKYIGCDMHKKFSVFVSMDERGRVEAPVKVANDSLELQAYLHSLATGTPIAVEASGGWYWFVDVLEEAGLDVRLVHPLEAKKRMAGRNKTDTLDATGLAMLLRNGTLPEVWIPPATLRDLRGLLRTRLALRQHTTTLKNRIHGALRRYGQCEPGEPRNLFAGKGRVTWVACRRRRGWRRDMNGSWWIRSKHTSGSWRCVSVWALDSSVPCGC